MKLTVDWRGAFERDVRNLPNKEVAERLCKAIQEFADTGTGPVTRYNSENPRRLKLIVRGAVAYLFADEREEILYVGRAYRR